jgi:hypothetical protein
MMPLSTPTKAHLKAGFVVVTAVAEAIRTAGKIPSGTLYSMLLDKMTLAEYERVIQILKNTDLVQEKHHELIWIGPEVKS